MDPNRSDTLTKILAIRDTRRRLFTLLASLPLIVTVTERLAAEATAGQRPVDRLLARVARRQERRHARRQRRRQRVRHQRREERRQERRQKRRDRRHDRHDGRNANNHLHHQVTLRR